VKTEKANEWEPKNILSTCWSSCRAPTGDIPMSFEF
jgi:hypothetical protein